MSCIVLKSKVERRIGAIWRLRVKGWLAYASESSNRGKGQKMPDKTNSPSHVTRTDVFDDLKFSQAEAAALKIKATILTSLLERIRQERYTQAKLAEILDDYQPNISNLLNGKISRMSIEKLLAYAHHLNLNAEIILKFKPASVRSKKVRMA
jgi:predicted XRE-type DNA-binding protein